MTKTEQKAALYKKIHPDNLATSLFSESQWPSIDPSLLAAINERYRAYFDFWIATDAEQFLLTTTKSTWRAGAKSKGFAIMNDGKCARLKNVTVINVNKGAAHIWHNQTCIKKLSLFSWKKVSVDHGVFWYDGQKITDL